MSDKQNEKDKKIEALEKKLIKAEKEIDKLMEKVERDDLTGLNNRFGFINEISSFVKSIEKEQELGDKKLKRSLTVGNITILFVDLNDFKEINDNYGHEVGDKALRKVADTLAESVRDIDIVSRWSGDEFVVALIGEGLENSETTIHRIKYKLEYERKSTKDYPVPKVSIGAASIFEEERKEAWIFDINKIIDIADERMYENKRLQKGDKIR